MIKYISSWAEQIIIAVIIATIIEMILPKGNSKKYIKTIIGVYILYTIISPAITLITGSDIKIDYSEYNKYFNTTDVSSNIEVPTIEDTYKSELDKQIKSDLEKMGYSVNKINTELNLDEGIINKIVLSVNKKELQEDKNINISVNKIEVGNVKEENQLSNSEIKDIKQKINENYGVQFDNIIVNSI